MGCAHVCRILNGVHKERKGADTTAYKPQVANIDNMHAKSQICCCPFVSSKGLLANNTVKVQILNCRIYRKFVDKKIINSCLITTSLLAPPPTISEANLISDS